VCAGVWIMRVKRPEIDRPFRTPWVPVVPILGMVVSFYLMASLPWPTWERLIIWLLIGMVIYFLYGIKHSKVQHGETVHVDSPPSGDTYTASTRKK